MADITIATLPVNTRMLQSLELKTNSESCSLSLKNAKELYRMEIRCKWQMKSEESII
jgi:hypothetical protein